VRFPLKARLLILILGLGLALAAGIVSVLLLRPHRAPPSAHVPEPTPRGCPTAPAVCGFPGAATTGVPPGTALRAVPRQVSSGPGWHFDARTAAVEVTGNGTVLSGLRIPCTLDITASHVTVRDVQVTTGGNFGISLRHTAAVTIEDSAISGVNTAAGRVTYAIDDVYGDSTGMVIKNDNISAFRTAVQVSTGLVTGNYIHDPGYIAGDHTNGIYVAGTSKPLTIRDNTILNNRGQTDAINLDPPKAGQSVANKTIEGNLLAGGGYTIYGGDVLGAATSNIVITGNWFSQIYYPHGGRYGPAAYFNTQAPGNTWAGNIWSGPARPGGTRRSDIRADSGPSTTVPPPRSPGRPLFLHSTRKHPGCIIEGKMAGAIADALQ
jgi:hypothetical protein